MKRIVFSLIVLFSYSLLLAAGVNAVLLNADGSEQPIRFFQLRNDTVFYSIAKIETSEEDSVIIDSTVTKFKAHKYEIRQITMSEKGSLVDLSMSNFRPVDLDSLRADSLSQINEAKVKAELKKQGNSTVYIESVPAGAQIYVNEKALPGVVTPAYVSKLQKGKNIIQVHRYLKSTDWWGTREIVLIDKDTVKTKIKLEKPTTNFKVISKPSLAEVFIDNKRTLNNKPNMISDTLVGGIIPGDGRTISFYKIGYQDTSIVMNIEPFVINRVEVDLKPLTNPDIIAQQNKFIKKRKHRSIAKILLVSALAPLAAGGTLFLMANHDYTRANEREDVYNLAAFESPETQQMVKENKDFIKSGDTKLAIGIGCSALSLGLAISGVLLYF